MFAASEFRLSKRRKDGTTLRDHLLAAYRQSGIMPQELADAPTCPQSASHVWMWFLELSATRQTSGFSVSPISYGEVEAWASLTGTITEPWEVTAIRAIDLEFVKVMGATE